MNGPHPIRSILLIRLGGLGDVVFTLPAVNALQSAFPNARFTYLVYKEFSSLVGCFPGIDKIVELDRSLYRGLNPITLLTEGLGLLGKLSRGRFDLTVDFQGFGETGLLSLWTRAPRRWGMVYRATRSWTYTRGIRRNDALHPIEFQLELLKNAGGISPSPLPRPLTVPAEALQEAKRLLVQWKVAVDRPSLFIQPFSNVHLKNWPLDHYLATACELRNRGVQVLFGGGPSERPALEPSRQAGFVVAAGTPILVSAALVSLCTVTLGGDTGLLHLGVALGKRVVMIINSLAPGKCFPFGHPDWTVLSENPADVFSVRRQQVLEGCLRALAECELIPKATRPDLAGATNRL